MGRDGILGSFEQLVMLAVAHDGRDAYGMRIRREIEERSGRSVSIGAVYATLERLASKGLLETWTVDGDAERKGRARRYYRLLPEGVHALEQARAEQDRMWEGVDLGAVLDSTGRPG